MNNVKIVYFNVDTIDKVLFETTLYNNPNCRSHIEIKSGLILVNYVGSAKDLYDYIEGIALEKSVLVHDLDSADNAYWGFQNKVIWEWLKLNRV